LPTGCWPFSGLIWSFEDLEDDADQHQDKRLHPAPFVIASSREDRKQKHGPGVFSRGHEELAMRLLLFIPGVFVAILCIEKPAEAQNYPWCAQYGATPSAPTNCGFVTFQQCLDTISGIGGFCVRNNTYQPPPGPHPSKKVRTRPPS